LSLGFAACYTLFTILPALLPTHVRSTPSLTYGDFVELAGPFVLAFWYVALFTVSPVRTGRLGSLFFFLALLCFVDGAAMHLSANSIRHYIPEGSREDQLAYFFDEHLSHAIWRTGVDGLAAVLIWRHASSRLPGLPAAATIGAAALYGLTTAIASIEAQTVVLDLPVAIVFSGIFLVAFWRPRRLPGDTVFTMFGLAHLLAAVLVLGWGLYWGGFPEFSSLGWIS
jgi:hypothetical protein